MKQFSYQSSPRTDKFDVRTRSWGSAGVTGAEFSPCMKFRYLLWRVWFDPRQTSLPSASPRAAQLVMFICLNPSTADAINNDPTVRRCIGFAKLWGFGGLIVANIFAYRSTDPAALRTVGDVVGPDNDAWLTGDKWTDAIPRPSMVVAAWGNHGAFMRRGEHVAGMLSREMPYCLGVTKTGHPKHPLYLGKRTELVQYEWRRAK